jgi:NADH-quinone oxidoreductase subunit M
MTINDICFIAATLTPFVVGSVIMTTKVRLPVWHLALAAVAASAMLRLHLFHSDAIYELHRILGGVFYRDTLNDMISLFYTCMIMVILAAMPVPSRSPQQISKLLFFLSFSMTFFHADSFMVLLAAWVGIVFIFGTSVKRNAAFFVCQTAALLFFCSAVWLCQDSLSSFTTTAWITSSGDILSTEKTIWVVFAIVLAGALSQGLFPFHIGLKSVATRSEFSALIAFVTANAGLYIVVRYGMQFGDKLPVTASRLVEIWILCAFIYLSISALAVNNIRHLYIALMSIQSTLVWVGFLNLENLGQSGALIQWVVALTAGTGFGLCIWLFENRTGVRRLNKSTVAYDKMPRLAMLFLIFGMCVIDFPGTLGFISEDLLIHSLVESSAITAAVVLACMAFTSIAVYRGYVALFLGRKLGSSELVVDLTKREACTFLFVLVLLVGMGIFPNPITERALNSVNGQFHSNIHQE